MANKNKINWTAQQGRAITSRAGEVLVTASAGTGKTSVLSGRYLDIVETEPVDVRQILVLTFTEAA
ncbi:MAG: UvrD-helicase domain-containing protein, partial [Planctomycetota bacterium]